MSERRDSYMSGARSAPPSAASATPTSVRWETRLDLGLAVAGVPADVRAPLAGALGMAGVEAEYFLTLARSLHADVPMPSATSPRAIGEAFLVALDAAGRRLLVTAGRVELATQAFLTALSAIHPAVDSAMATTPPWWGEATSIPWSGLTIEMDLRRHGFSLRQMMQVRLGWTLESLAERMALTLQALTSLPPAGVLPVGTLAAGLYQIAELWQDDIAHGLVRDVTPAYAGLLSALVRLRAEDAAHGADVQADLAWAHAQYALARDLQNAGSSRADGSLVRAAERVAMVDEELRVWQETVGWLESLQHTQ